ncbi:hypothetical protein PFICI_02248 [Pestalotiopsis fici W106-1]|uniref:Uncharacterized protein n=1 Tax=Pestalotiopsis fici (strain W106-1 / CGMCC3.15140) TaxID=1229662 RepID=W3XDS7_PESFW|nr:uncharacterized protein PFICI_02248 [Pestalotiopsis fici W106-1]ETS84223.1 hypothetical protein PFICI_02248 [Pestalotiopsis fici W106-1]
MPRVINRRGGRVIPGPGRGGFRGGLIGGRGGFGVPLVPVVNDGNVEYVTEESSSSPSRPAEGGSDGEFEPDLEDVFLVKDLLKRAGDLPDEIALMILDSAEYWACSSTTVEYDNLQRGSLHIRGTTGENKFLVRSEPLGMSLWSPDDQEAWHSQARPQEIREVVSREKLHEYVDKRIDAALESPCRKIVFKITSHDQGWGGNIADKGTFKGSWTWFDAGIDRFTSEPESLNGKAPSEGSGDVSVSSLRPVWPPIKEADDGSTVYDHGVHAAQDHKIQGNKTATRETQHHTVEWNYADDINPELSEADKLEDIGRGRATGNGEFVRNLKLGDMVTVWGRARFGGWENVVKKVELKIYWKAA